MHPIIQCIQRCIFKKKYYSPCGFFLTFTIDYASFILAMSSRKYIYKSRILLQVFECLYCGRKAHYDDWVIYTKGTSQGYHWCKNELAPIITYLTHKKIGPFRPRVSAKQHNRTAIFFLILSFIPLLTAILGHLIEEILWLL